MNELVNVRITLTVKTEISSREELPDRNIYTTSEVVSGKKVRGALFSSLRRDICPYGSEVKCDQCRDKNKCEFYEDLLPAISRFSSALPSCDCKHPLEIESAPTTFVTCKLCSQKGAEPVDATSKFLKDGYLSGADFCTNHEENYLQIPYSKRICLNCGSQLPSGNMNTRPAVSLDDHVGSAKSGALFFSQTVSFNQPLSIIATLESQLVDKVEELVTNKDLIQLGAGRGKGWGIVDIVDINKETENEFIKRKEEPLREVVELYDGFLLIAKTGTSTLCSSDSGFASIPRVDSVDGCKLKSSFGRATNYTGWSLRTGLQKPLVQVASPGSVFFYNVENVDDIDYAELARKELTGIGQDIMKRSQLNQVIFWEGSQ